MKETTYRDARKRVKKKKGFYVHLAVFLSVGLFFLLMNIATFEGELWFFFPLLPWGVGLAIHYLTVFGFPGSGILTREWEEREMQRELYKRGYPAEEEGALPLPDNTEEELKLDEAPRKLKEKRKSWDEDEIV